MMGMTIYRGAGEIISNPSLEKEGRFHDYGRGFHAAWNQDIARECCKNMGKECFLNIYEIDTDGLDILDILPVSSIGDMYHPYHEMDIRHFILEMNRLYMEKYPFTNLRYRRDISGLSQKQLSTLSGVPFRTIQQYEQRKMNMNKAQVEYLYMLAKVLHCRIEELLEKVPGATEEIEKLS